ncbi:Rrf2 family transcriptional regulator [Amycolatopsis ultiminotia]|uniref:Rrf2 family transcriptional regulator n=1 Tax=Amycolatopsis ultiminotia TaxID=543629 RepID=A0ABP6XDI9_9PSEU
MQISAKSDYAIRAALEIARREPELVTATEIVNGQDLPRKFVEAILSDLRRAGLVHTQRGSAGGYALTRPAREVSLGAIIRAVDGPLTAVRGVRPHETSYTGAAEHLPQLWVALRCSLRRVLDETTLQHILTGRLPAGVRRLTETDDAWLPR